MFVEKLKLVVFVPVDYASQVREAIGDAGAGSFGHYSHWSFSVRGVGRFKPGPGAQPFRGQIGRLEEVDEERIEVVLERAQLGAVLKALRQSHPYEEVAFEVYPLLDISL